ncbi:hypothetical protein ABZ858_21065 [Streptomyces sp. NPDC047017]
MAGLFELLLTVDLRDEVTRQEIAELHGHLGLGPRPQTLRIVTASRA